MQRRSSCPVACTLDVLGDRWTLLVIRDLFLGKERFEEFLASAEGIATNILAERLRRLTENDLVEARVDPAHRGRRTYHLTSKGASLEPVVRSVVVWGLQNFSRTKVLPRTR